MLKLVESQSQPQNESLYREHEKEFPKNLQPFSCKVRSQGTNLYILEATDPSHYLDCQLVIEIENDRSNDQENHVICHIPFISNEDLDYFIDGDETLFRMVMSQFYINIFQELLLFCKMHQGNRLTIYMDDSEPEGIEAFNNFFIDKMSDAPLQPQTQERCVLIDQDFCSEWSAYKVNTDIKFKQILWQGQRSNPSIQKYLMYHPFEGMQIDRSWPQKEQRNDRGMSHDMDI